MRTHRHQCIPLHVHTRALENTSMCARTHIRQKLSRRHCSLTHTHARAHTHKQTNFRNLRRMHVWTYVCTPETAKHEVHLNTLSLKVKHKLSPSCRSFPLSHTHTHTGVNGGSKIAGAPFCAPSWRSPYIHIHTHTHTYTPSHEPKHTHTHTCAHTRTHKHTRTHTHAHI